MENRESENDEVSGGVWKVVETSIRKIGVGETKRRRSKGRNRKKEGRER